jgi:type VI secretion system protein VasJ
VEGVDAMNEIGVSPLHEPDPRLVAPISAETPAGADLSYDPDFERLVAEIEKLTSLAGELPDWHFVLSECERTLREKSKDLRVMSWLVAAHAYTSGWSGIATGLAAYAALTRSYWPTLFPPVNRLRARAGQVEWLWSVLAKRVAALPVDAADAPLARSLEPRVAELNAFFAEHLKEADPGGGSFRAALRDKLRALAEAAPPPPAPIAPPSAAGPASTASAQAAPDGTSSSTPSASTNGNGANGAARSAAIAAGPPPAIASVAIDASSLAGLEQTQDAAGALRDPLTTLAHHARRVAPATAWPYRVLRFSAWLTVERAPDAEGDKTPLRAPKGQDRELLTSLHAAGQWDALLEAAEDAVATNILWLDPHRMSALALEHKGPEFRAARQAVGRETAWFLERVPGLTHLTFSNGTPFASPETIDWLAAEQGRFTRTAAGTTSGSGAGQEASADDAALLASLDERLATGSADEAFAQTLADAERLGSPRSRFRAHLAVARKAQTADHLDVAHALYERLLLQVDSTLEQWEPALSAEAIGGFLKVLRLLGRNRKGGAAEQETDDRREALLFRRLLALDPHAALRSRA